MARNRLSRPRIRACAFLPVLVFTFSSATADVGIPVDLAAYSRSSGVEVTQGEGRLRAEWLMDSGERGALTLDLRPGKALVESFVGILNDGVL